MGLMVMVMVMGMVMVMVMAKWKVRKKCTAGTTMYSKWRRRQV